MNDYIVNYHEHLAKRHLGYAKKKGRRWAIGNRVFAGVIYAIGVYFLFQACKIAYEVLTQGDSPLFILLSGLYLAMAWFEFFWVAPKSLKAAQDRLKASNNWLESAELNSRTAQVYREQNS